MNKKDDRPKHRITTVVSALFGLLFSGLLYYFDAPREYWLVMLVGTIVILGTRAIFTECGIRKSQ